MAEVTKRFFGHPATVLIMQHPDRPDDERGLTISADPAGGGFDARLIIQIEPDTIGARVAGAGIEPGTKRVHAEIAAQPLPDPAACPGNHGGKPLTKAGDHRVGVKY